MSIFFANPLWLLGLLAAVPIAAHLFSRARPRKRPFPSLVLLREAIRKVTRIRRPQDRWLLLLRSLAIIAIILAFLQPLLQSRFTSTGNTPKTVVLVVDASASMGYVDGTRARLTQATVAAEELLETLPRNSRANVVWVRAQPVSVLPEPAQNFDFLRDELRQETARPETGDIDGSLALALKQLSGSDGERELCVISDFQRSTWKDQAWSMPPNVKLTRIAIGSEPETNVGLGSLELEPAEPGIGQPAQMVARIRNFSGEPRRVTVFGEAGASRLSQTVELAPWSEGLAVMPVTFAAEGLTLLKASVGEDRYPGDDVRYALTNVRGALPVGVIGDPEKATAKTWLRAMRSLDGIAPRVMTADQIASAGAKILFVADWDGTAAESLKVHMKAGGALVVQPAAGLSASAVSALLNEAQAVDAQSSIRLEESPAGWGVRITAEDHPIFALFASGAYGDPVGAKFRKRLGITLKSGRPLLAYDDGVPALLWNDATFGETTTPLVLWNMDLAVTDWTSRSAFLPFFGEFLKHLASYARSHDLVELRSGEHLRFEADPAIDPRDVELVDAADRKVPISATTGGRSGEMATVDRISPGAYRWMAQGAVLKRMVVNFPDTESDLRRMDRETLEAKGGQVIAGDGSTRFASLREGIALWPWCLAFAALCLLVEGWILRGIAKSSVRSHAPVPSAKSESKEVAKV